MLYELEPKGFVAVGRERWTKRAKAYFAWKEQAQLLGVTLPDNGAYVVFFIPMPKSWSKKKKAQMIGQPHQQRPDLSNLIKALEDAARYNVPQGDQTIWQYAGLVKYWSDKGEILIEHSRESVPADTDTGEKDVRAQTQSTQTAERQARTPLVGRHGEAVIGPYSPLPGVHD